MSETSLRHKAEAPTRLNFAVIVCSSSRYRELKAGRKVDDPSGDLIVQALQKSGHTVISRAVVPDDTAVIEKTVGDALLSGEIDAVITCGGTGITPTDVTIEAVQPLLEKELPGFGEIFRNLSFKETGSAAMLTRAIAGVAGGKAVFCIPGSPQAVALAVEKLILPEAPHIVKHSREQQ